MARLQIRIHLGWIAIEIIAFVVEYNSSGGEAENTPVHGKKSNGKVLLN